MKPRRIAILVVLAAAALSVSACGNKQDRLTHGETEGAYIDVGPLKYQVQISRALNPASTEDRTYLDGVSAADRALRADETWFAVFVRVENESGRPARTASQFKIVDTQENVFLPVPIARNQDLAYRPVVLADKHYVPDVEDIAAFSPTQGKLLLFKIPTVNLDDRPLELTIQSPTPPVETGTVTLDV